MISNISTLYSENYKSTEMKNKKKEVKFPYGKAVKVCEDCCSVDVGTKRKCRFFREKKNRPQLDIGIIF